MGFFDFLMPRKTAPVPSTPPEPKKPLLLFAEMRVEHTSKCNKKELHKKAHIVDRDGNVLTYEEALLRYYGAPEGFYRWSFNLEDITLIRKEKTYTVVGDGIVLGDVFQSRYDNSFVRMLDDLIYMNKVDHYKLEIKDCASFYLTEEEYNEYVTADPYNRGFPSWSDRRPDVTLYVYFEDGVIDLSDYNTGFEFPDPDKILKGEDYGEG